MPTPRRHFLGWLGASGLAAASGVPLASHSAAAEQPHPRRPLPAPVGDSKWDMGWVDKVTGKHRAVFDTPELAEGAGMFRAVMWREQHKEVYGTEPTEASAVLVIRHAAIDMAMNDAYWKRFKLGKEYKLRNQETKKWETVNPFRTAEGAPPKWARYSLEALMADGGTVLACNIAFQKVVRRFRKADKLAGPEAEQRAKEHLLPGIALQPSGIFAVLCAQEAGCSYVMAS
jgi:hypothetical protein